VDKTVVFTAEVKIGGANPCAEAPECVLEALSAGAKVAVLVQVATDLQEV